MTISATDILVPVCSKIPLLYLLTQKVAQKFGYVLGIGKQQGFICHDEKVAYLTFEGRKEAKKIVKTTFLQKK